MPLITSVLSAKLILYRIQETAYDWFKSYLNNRSQKCVINGSLSKVCSLAVGSSGNNPMEAVFLVRLQAPSDISSPVFISPLLKPPYEDV